MFWIIIAIIAVVAFIGLSMYKETKYPTDRWGERLPDAKPQVTRFPLIVRLAPLLVLAAFTIPMSLTTVDTKNVGVLLDFKAVSDRNLGPGLSVKFPWQKVVEIDGTRQVDEYNEANGNALKVRLGDGVVATVWTQNRWRISKEQGDTIYSEFRSNDPTQTLRSNIVSTNFKTALNDVLGQYNPTEEIDSLNLNDPKALQAAGKINFTPDIADLSAKVKALEEKLIAQTDTDPLVDIESVTISFIDFGAKTDERINAYLEAANRIRVAALDKQSASLQAEANKLLAQSSKDPGVASLRCLDLYKAGIEAGYQFNTFFTCIPGAQGTGVVSVK